MDKTEAFQKLTKKLGKSEAELESELAIIRKEVDAMPISDEDKGVIALRRLMSEYRKQLMSRAEIFEGIFIRTSDPFDMVAKARKEAVAMYNDSTTREECIEKGITDTSGNPLVYVDPENLATTPQFIKDTIGNPLPEHDWQRIGTGVVKVGEQYVKMSYRFRGENVKAKVPLFTQMKFPGYHLSSSTDELVNLNDSGSFSANVIRQLNDKEVENLLRAKFASDIITLDKFESFCEQNQKFGRYIIAKVLVTDLIPQKTKTGATMITIEDDYIADEMFNEEKKKAITVFINNEDLLTFGKKAEIWLIGQPNIGEKGRNVNAQGIYTPSIYRNLVPKVKDVGEARSW